LRNHIRLGHLLGIPLRVDPTWLLIFAWATWSLSTAYVPQRLPEANSLACWLLGTAMSILFFLSVVLHELGHALVARAQGQPVRQITLFIFGGAAEISGEPDTARKELLLALVGPGVSLLLGLVFLGVGWLAATVPWLSTMALYLGSVNLALGVFNLVPGFPLDGGRVLRAIIWARTGSNTVATQWAVRVGRTIAFCLMGLGLLLALQGRFGDGLWFLLIGSFLDSSAASAYAQMSLNRMLAGHKVSEVMTSDCPFVPPQLTLDLFVEHYLMHQSRRCYLVGSADRPLGLLTVHQVQQVPRDRWPVTRTGEVCRPLAELRTVTPDTPLTTALEQMTVEGVNQLPVITGDELVGMITREGLLTFIQERAARGEQ